MAAKTKSAEEITLLAATETEFVLPPGTVFFELNVHSNDTVYMSFEAGGTTSGKRSRLQPDWWTPPGYKETTPTPIYLWCSVPVTMDIIIFRE